MASPSGEPARSDEPHNPHILCLAVPHGQLALYQPLMEASSYSVTLTTLTSPGITEIQLLDPDLVIIEDNADGAGGTRAGRIGVLLHELRRSGEESPRPVIVLS